jgi:hypothetical protein
VTHDLPSSSGRSLVESLRSNPASPRFTDEEWSALDRHLDPVVKRTVAWCQPLPIKNPIAAVPVSVVSIVALSNIADPEAIAIRAKNSMWIYALDDVLDDLSQPMASVEDLVRECRLAIMGEGIPKNEVASALAALMADFDAFPNYRLFRSHWQTSMLMVLDGMLFERSLAGASVPQPAGEAGATLDAYIGRAAQTTALQHLFVAGLFVDPDRRNFDIYDELWRCAWPCAVAMRFANDLAGFDREHTQGEANAVSILARQQAGSEESAVLDAAREAARDRIASELGAARLLVDQLNTPTGAERRIYRATVCGIEMYLRGDFRDWEDGSSSDPLGANVA